LAAPPAETLERTELRRALRNAIASLRPAYREVFMMRDVENLSIAETAEVLENQPGSGQDPAASGKMKLRDALAPGIDGAWSVCDGSWKKVRPW